MSTGTQKWLTHWDNMTIEEATWEDVLFIQDTFPSFKL
jgi:hypothetical protein